MGDSRVIMVDGKGSGWYEKAIFILADQREGEKEIPDSIVKRAENIVESYLQKELRGEMPKATKDYKVTNQTKINGRSDKTVYMLKGFAVVSLLICLAAMLSHFIN